MLVLLPGMLAVIGFDTIKTNIDVANILNRALLILGLIKNGQHPMLITHVCTIFVAVSVINHFEKPARILTLNGGFFFFSSPTLQKNDLIRLNTTHELPVSSVNPSLLQ